MKPTVRQNECLRVEAWEALYGGARGGGKSEFILMWLAEGIDIPDYSGIVFRRTFAQLTKSNDSLVAKSMRLYPSLGGRYNSTLRQWKFPSGAMIELGALEHENSIQNYQGNAFHRASFEELTHFSESQYDFIVNTCIRKRERFPISCGARSTANPGGPGHIWVMKRFVTKEAVEKVLQLDIMEPTPTGYIFKNEAGRAFIPARLADNPHLDREEYIRSLSSVTNPIMRARMLNGDWTVQEDGVIDSTNLRYYHMQGMMYQNNDHSIRVDHRSMLRAIFVDCAGSSEEVAKEQRGGTASYSVAQVWDYDAGPGNMFMRDMIRGRWTFPELCNRVEAFMNQWNPQWTGIEDEKTGRALLQYLRTRGHNLRPLSHEGKDKLNRASAFLNRISQHQIHLLENAPWLSELQSEWFSWTGHPDEPADTIDPAAYMAREFGNNSGLFVLGKTNRLRPFMNNSL